jgi:hypothetical protein
MRRYLGCLLLLFCPITAQCKPVNEGFVEVVRPDYSIEFPATWEVGPGWTDQDVSALAPTEPSGEGFHENVSVLVDNHAGGLSLDQYYDVSLKGLKALATDFHLEKSGETTIGGKRARFLLYTHRAGTYTFRALQYILVANQKAYLITATSMADSFAQFEREFQRIAASFRLRTPSSAQ